jgi:glycosyltransferase involved in cell wall biosynthesis
VVDTLALILELRPDLCRRFGFDRPERRQAFLAWLVTTGVREYAALVRDAGLRQMLAEPSEVAGLTNLQSLVLQGRPDVQAAFPLPEQLAGFLQWFFSYGVTEHILWPWLLPPEPLPTVHRAFGVNLVGYAFGQLGIGEDARMAAHALLAAGVPMTMLNFEPGADIGQNDSSMAQHVSLDGPYAINLFCLTALETGRYYVERGRSQFEGRYNIGYWPWELSRWPAQWQDLINLVDEVWVSTQHTHDALAPVIAAMARPVPLLVMPMAVELGPVAHAGSSKQRLRKHFGLPARACLFCFSFDLNSSVHRKNPQAVVDAFLQAFPDAGWGSDRVGLMVKVHPPKRRNPAWERLKALAERDPRIHIVEATLQRPELLALYRSCDCFVSLHRAEGFGRGIAEALQLGLHVITTGYSGNLDFCQQPGLAPQVDLVRYRLVKVRKGQYPYAADQVWANADVPHAASRMRAFADGLATKKPASTVHPVPEGGWPVFAASTVGQRYRKRLKGA